MSGVAKGDFETAEQMSIIMCVCVLFVRKGDRIYQQLKKLGSSLDWDRACFTMDPVSVFAPLNHYDYIVSRRFSSSHLGLENVLCRPRGLHPSAR